MKKDKLNAGMTEHVVVLTSTGLFPGDNGWLFYYCSTCGAAEHFISAARFNHGSWFDHEGYGKAFDAFNAAHPHTEVQESQWAQ